MLCRARASTAGGWRGCIPQHFGRGMQCLSSPLLRETCVNHHNVTFNWVWTVILHVNGDIWRWHSTSHHSLEDRLLKLANTIFYLNGPRALILLIEKSLAAQFHSWSMRYTSFIIMITRNVLFSLKCTRKRLAAGLRPDPLGELKRSPRPPSHITGLGPQGGRGIET